MTDIDGTIRKHKQFAERGPDPNTTKQGGMWRDAVVGAGAPPRGHGAAVRAWAFRCLLVTPGSLAFLWGAVLTTSPGRRLLSA